MLLTQLLNFLKTMTTWNQCKCLFAMNNLKAHSRNKHHSQNNVIINEQLNTCLCPANMNASLGSMLRLSVSSA